MKRLFIAAAAVCALLLGGCATAPEGSIDRQKSAATVEASYALVKITAGLYVALPRCGTERATSVCSDPAIAVQIGKALEVADVAVTEAVKNILTAPNDGEVTQWRARALSAVAVLAVALQTYGVK
jgi:hypothetical protein